MLAESEHVSVPTWIRLAYALSALAVTAAATTIVATQLAPIPRLDDLMSFMIAAPLRSGTPSTRRQLMAPFAARHSLKTNQRFFGAGGAMMPRAK